MKNNPPDIKGYTFREISFEDVYDEHTYLKEQLKVGNLYCVDSKLGPVMLMKYEAIEEYTGGGTKATHVFTYLDDTPDKPLTPKNQSARQKYGEILEFENAICFFNELFTYPEITLYEIERVNSYES
jgi:hypothetical protein